MSDYVTLVANDGHELSAYRAVPKGPVRGGIVVLQEIFGVNEYIRSVCDRLADAGYVALAPALFDRLRKDFECGYSPDEVAGARELLSSLDWSAVMLDTAAAADALKASGPVGVVGFCLGGSIAFLSAARLEQVDAAVGYYGSRIAANADLELPYPVQLHFGEQDQGIPLSDVELIRQKQPACEIHLYPAGHGFDCHMRGSYDAESAKLAWQRTLDWFETHLPRT